MPHGDPKDEYLDASANQRHYQSIRFGQLTVYFAASAVLGNVLLSDVALEVPYVGTSIAALGLLITLLFWVHQERTMAYWNHFVRRAAELEAELGYEQYRTRPPAGLLSSFKAMRVFFIAAAILGFL